MNDGAVGYIYGCPMPGSRHEPHELPNEDAVAKQRQISSVCNEIDLMRALAKLFDAAPVDVQERVAAWVMSKYGKSFVVATSRPPVERNPVEKVPWPQPNPMPNSAPMCQHYLLGGNIGVAVSDGFPVADVDDSTVDQ